MTSCKSRVGTLCNVLWSALTTASGTSGTEGPLLLIDCRPAMFFGKAHILHACSMPFRLPATAKGRPYELALQVQKSVTRM